MLIEWGKDNSPQALTRIVQTKLPANSCEVNVLPTTRDGLKKIGLMIAAQQSGAPRFYHDRIARAETVFLVADDDMYMRLLAHKGLEPYGRVVEVADGASIEDAYKLQNPDMVLLDIHMPGLDGQTALARLTALDPKAYVIMLSADSSLENVKGARQNGASGFLAKPFDKARLIKYVEACPTISKT
jgi:two-component system chemotaxis response regulator CheY